MITFLNWLDTVSIREFVIFYLLICIVLCAIILAVDWWFATREQRAIRRRDAKLAKRKSDDLLLFPIERTVRIERRKVDPAYRSGQFHVPYGQRDFKGIHK